MGQVGLRGGAWRGWEAEGDVQVGISARRGVVEGLDQTGVVDSSLRAKATPVGEGWRVPWSRQCWPISSGQG